MDRGDLVWLQRVTFGLDTATVERFRALGRHGYLEEQLAARDERLPPVIAAQVREAEAFQRDPQSILLENQAQGKRVTAMTDAVMKDAARKAFRETFADNVYQAARSELLHAIYSPAQLKEQMDWFWLNHFNIYADKSAIQRMTGDYARSAIRPHALGHFRDIVMATLMHPAMIQYLDNTQNAVGHINENYARELMELHTLGVDAGYSQKDVQELARILTGVGVITGPEPPDLKPEWRGLYKREGGFEFNPARHDFGDKVLLGQTIRGSGFDEVEKAVDLLVRQPACAQFVSRKIARYFIADDPPQSLVDGMAHAFQQTDGDIAAVLRTMFEAPGIDRMMGRKFKDPMHFLVSTARLEYDGSPMYNERPLVAWLIRMNEQIFGHQTPDGYSLKQGGWDSSGQLSTRFEIARTLGFGSDGLSTPQSGFPALPRPLPQLGAGLYAKAIEPGLGAPTREALKLARSQQEWNTFLLASPEWNYR